MEPALFIQIDENPNCAPMDGMVFQPKAPPREVKRVRVSRGSVTEWCEISGVTETGVPCPALASPIDDSGDGACYLVTGGSWGLRLSSETGSVGESYMLFGIDGSDLEFA